MTCINRKAKTEPVLMAVVIIGVAIVLVISAVGWHIWSMKESVDIYNKYFIAVMDKEAQSIKQGFEKTAIFFSLMDTSKELAEHGGHAQVSLEDTDMNSRSDLTEGTAEPKIIIKKDLESPENIPLWLIPDCENALKRVPYLKNGDVSLKAGDYFVVLMYNQYGSTQYINEINAGKYPLYVSIQIYMLKNGTVRITCEADEGCLDMEPLPGTPDVIDKDGIYVYKIKKIDGSKMATSLHFTGRNSTDGIDNVAILKQVVASIYDPEIITTQNTLFTQYLNKYHARMEDIITDRNTKSDIKLTIAPLKGTMTRSYGFVEGTVWSEEGGESITLKVDDKMSVYDNLAEIRDSGLVTEETKIRYYKLYTNAEKFTNNAQQLFQIKLWDMLHNLDKHGFDVQLGDKCGYPQCSDPNWCRNDEVASYTRDQMYTEIISALDQIKTECDALTSAEGIKWHIEYHTDDYSPHTTTNVNKGACAAAEHIETNNFEYLEYITVTYKYVYRDYSCCCCVCHGCGSTAYHYQDVNRCIMYYNHRYLLKNMKIYIKITDEKYKIYNANTNTWENLEFKFYIAIPIVDMNCCGDNGGTGHLCNDLSTSCTNPYGTIAPTDYLSSTGPLEITSYSENYLTDDSILIEWTTNKPADSMVKYRATSSVSYTEIPDTAEVSGHTISIYGLEPSTVYYYIIESTAGDETATSDEKTFTTSADMTRPEIEFIKPTPTELAGWLGTIVELEVDASDDVAIDRVEFYLYKDIEDEASKVNIHTTSNTPPYTYTVDIEEVLGFAVLTGSYQIQAIAYDTSVLGIDRSANIIVKVRKGEDAEITDITATTASYEASIKWTAPILTSGTFKYCLDTDCTSTDVAELFITSGDDAYDGPDPNLANFRMDILELQPDTTYDYTISVSTPGYDPVTETGTFKTLAPPPAISNIQAASITDTTATITWNTDVSADCHLDYGIAPSHEDAGSNDSTGTAHNIGISDLTPEAVYNYEITCTRETGSDPATEIGSFTTLAS